MEQIVNLHIEKLSEDISGLVAQGRTITETLEIARDVAKKILEAQVTYLLKTTENSFDYPLIVGG
jgi:hypothetical protein